ncbi:MAG TPA: tetratricopeptide repeat protein, partial [Dermatophilaceae bacterium]
MLALLNAPLWLRLTGIVLVAAVGVASEVDKMRSKHVEKAEEDARKQNEADAAEKRWLRTARSSLWTWPPPAVGEVNPQLLAGPANRALTEANPPVPAYVRRDADERADKQLRAHGMVLLIGAPSSGVTRTAYELAATEDATRLLLAPYPPLGLKTALDDLDVLSRLEPPVRLVLWLDRIDRFTPSGLTVPMLQECRERSPGLRVVATISSTKYGRWVQEERQLATTFVDPVTVSRQLSEREMSRAQAAHPETDFGEGIAAAFTSTRSLLERMRAGDTNCPFEAEGDDCALARVVLEVALSWTNTGNPRDLTISGLMDLAKYWLHTAAVDPAHLSHALAWAAGRVTQGGSLVSRSTTDAGGATVRAHPGLAEIYDAEHSEGPPLPVWIAALDDADGVEDSDTVGRLGYNAHVRGNTAVAQIAWARVTNIDQPGSQWLKRAAAFSREAHQLADAVPPLDRLLSLTESSRGVEHQEVAVVLNELGTVMVGLRNPTMARDLFQRALPILEKAYGPDNPLVAPNLNNLGTAWFDLGNPAKARDLFERALPILEKAYGPDNPLVAPNLNNLGSAWFDLGNPAKARDLFERAL